MTAFCFHTHGTDYKQREIGDSVFIAPRADVFFSPGGIRGVFAITRANSTTQVSPPYFSFYKDLYVLACALFDLPTCLFSERPLNCIS